MKISTGKPTSTPPQPPRKDKISVENMKKMKLTAHKNAAEVHRRMSPMHDMNSNKTHPIVRNRESLVTPSETPIFSDAEKTNCSQLWNQILKFKYFSAYNNLCLRKCHQQLKKILNFLITKMIYEFKMNSF